MLCCSSLLIIVVVVVARREHHKVVAFARTEDPMFKKMDLSSSAKMILPSTSKWRFVPPRIVLLVQRLTTPQRRAVLSNRICWT